MVGAHPFGGFNMSGTDSKAGGPDYLYLFTQAKSVAEKLLTRVCIEFVEAAAEPAISVRITERMIHR